LTGDRGRHLLRRRRRRGHRDRGRRLRGRRGRRRLNVLRLGIGCRFWPDDDRDRRRTRDHGPGGDRWSRLPGVRVARRLGDRRCL